MHPGGHVYPPGYSTMQRLSTPVSLVGLVYLLNLLCTGVWFINGMYVQSHVWHIWATSGMLSYVSCDCIYNCS